MSDVLDPIRICELFAVPPWLLGLGWICLCEPDDSCLLCDQA